MEEENEVVSALLGFAFVTLLVIGTALLTMIGGSP